ncbi:alpha/beta hydrolase [Solimonas fluminis]|uniref:Alpha/beta hydrolase n=1 Tax=Solimonas fluminis TaxID=2086571 RepID=A0A2S5TBY1_9GAMM|nr:alpha/beta hydrolase [Solimonas fluminis]PPE72524.1 alpha/beta hydrolase [Solimonas fluminis]
MLPFNIRRLRPRLAIRRTLLPWLASLLLAVSLLPVRAEAASAAHAQTHYVTVNGDRIAYRSFGQGSPILFANRMRGTLDTWDPLFLDTLARQHRVITVDYPGVGYSSGRLPDDMAQVAGFLRDFADALKLERFAMLGWSWGGFASQTLLLQEPQRVTHAILVGTNPPGPGQLPIQQVFIERAIKPVNDLADEEVLFFEPKSAFSRAAAKASRERIYARPDVVSRIPDTMEEFQVYFKAASVFREDEAGRRDQLARSRTPLLILCGDNDTSTPGQNWFPLVGQLPNAQLIVYPESGHGPQHQYPELSAEYISRFLARTSR